MLVRSRAEVTEADSGVAALAELGRARAAGRPYRLMLLDYRMPGMDGVEVARNAIADGFTRTAAGIQDTIILMLTSDDLNFRLARMHEAGLHTYLIKPTKRVELLETIGNLLSGRDDAAEPRPTPDGQDATPADARPLRILLAEDAPDNRFFIQAYFKKLPYQIELAENGRIAIDKFKASPPDLVLMDVQMPEVDGLTATRAIRQWEAERGLPWRVTRAESSREEASGNGRGSGRIISAKCASTSASIPSTCGLSSTSRNPTNRTIARRIRPLI